MNQEIAAMERWGRPEILARAAALAERIISIWPRPTAAEPGESTVPWDVMNKALAELPAGSWTTYGDIAALIGSHPVPVGVRLATHAAPNAHRVLQVEGTVSANFRWLDPGRTDDPRDLLRAEGVEFDEHGRASLAQRIYTEELAQLAGVASEDLPDPVPDPDAGQDASRRDRFLQQLADLQGPEIAHATLVVLDAWATMGGRLSYGEGGETSCFLMARDWTDQSGGIWPATLYPSGKFEVVFQHLSVRPPFDDIALREELRQRLNEVPGVNIAAARITLRPGFPLSVLVAQHARETLLQHLAWFYDRAQIATNVLTTL